MKKNVKIEKIIADVVIRKDQSVHQVQSPSRLPAQTRGEVHTNVSYKGTVMRQRPRSHYGSNFCFVQFGRSKAFCRSPEVTELVLATDFSREYVLSLVMNAFTITFQVDSWKYCFDSAVIKVSELEGQLISLLTEFCTNSQKTKLAFENSRHCEAENLTNKMPSMMGNSKNRIIILQMNGFYFKFQLHGSMVGYFP